MLVLVLAGIAGLLLIAIVLWDAFETILLPRRIPRGVRLSRIVLRNLWRAWSAIGRRIDVRNQRESFLALYALLSLIGLLAVWASGLVVGFAGLYMAAGSQLETGGKISGPWAALYMSGTTFFTLGLGDVSPLSTATRIFTVIEAGTGFGFLALVLAYIPVLYQAFSRREARITMLDEWAGSPPTAAMLLKRCFRARDPGAALNQLLRDWELTAAEILESHLSYPILAFFRSQHDNQSWLAAMHVVLDACALVMVGLEGVDPFQARLTFAICRHALVDVSQNLRRRPIEIEPDTPETLAALRTWLEPANVRLASGADADRKLAELRRLYVPYVRSLATLLLAPLPDWTPGMKVRDNWQTTVWARTGKQEDHELDVG